MLKYILFLILLWIKFIHTIKQCDDCVLYTECFSAKELARRKEHGDTFRSAFCGYYKAKKPASIDLPMVCCSDFSVSLLNGSNPAVIKRTAAQTSMDTTTPRPDCADCIVYTSCPRAVESVRQRKNQHIFRRSHCGFDITQPQRVSKEKAYKVCCSEFDPVPIENHRNAHLLGDADCGDINGRRIVGGTTAGLYEFPWMALIAKQTDYSFNDSFVCGGSIINSRYILTAAHCVRNLSGVRVGDYNIASATDCQGTGRDYKCESHIQDIEIEEAIVHEGYSSIPDKVHDIALLRLKDPIDFTHRNVAPICLPTTEEMRNISLDNSTVTVAGWGRTETGRESFVLRKVEVPVVNWDTCVQKYQSEYSFFRRVIKLDENQICAGKFRKDSCGGDSGGPMMLQTDHRGSYRMVQYGLVSHGPKECGSSVPGVYTNVAKYMDWILDNIRE